MGFHEVFGALYDRLGFQKVFGARKKMAARLFRQAVLMRLAAPGSSKRACCDKLSRHHGVEVNPDNSTSPFYDSNSIGGHILHI